MVFVDNKLIGDTKTFLKWAIDTHNFEEFRSDSLYETLRKEAYASYILNTKVILFLTIIEFKRFFQSKIKIYIF